MKKVIINLLFVLLIFSCSSPLLVNHSDKYAHNKQLVRSKMKEQLQYVKEVIQRNGSKHEVCKNYTNYSADKIVYFKRLAKEINCLYRYRDFQRTSSWFKSQIGKPDKFNSTQSQYRVNKNGFHLSITKGSNNIVSALQFKIELDFRTFCDIGSVENTLGTVYYDHQIYEQIDIELPFYDWDIETNTTMFEFGNEGQRKESQ
jgi:hypothetical protein